MIRVITLALFLGLIASAQDAPPPPKPADDGPSLEVTMKFIEDKLNAQGNVSWVYTWQNSIAQTTGGPVPASEEAANATSDPKACTLRLHFKATDNAKVTEDADFLTSLKDVEKIQVMSLQERTNLLWAKRGHPEITVAASPAVWALVLSFTKDKKDGEVDFKFFDEELSHRMAKAMLRAVELCGGGKEPF